MQYFRPLIFVTVLALATVLIFINLSQSVEAVIKCNTKNGLPDRKCTPGATDPSVTQKASMIQYVNQDIQKLLGLLRM